MWFQFELSFITFRMSIVRIRVLDMLGVLLGNLCLQIILHMLRNVLILLESVLRCRRIVSFLGIFMFDMVRGLLKFL